MHDYPKQLNLSSREIKRMIYFYALLQLEKRVPVF
jgi:hypothetical protein